MDFSEWPQPLSSRQLHRKRTYQQIQRAHNSEPEFSTTTLSSHFPQTHRPSLPHNNSNINHNHNIISLSRYTSTRNTSTVINKMADRSRHRTSIPRASPYHTPRLQHRSSQTIIDLTGDSDNEPASSLPPPARSAPVRSTGSHRHIQRLPRLGRDDILGVNEPDDLIDLTADTDNQSEADLELIEVRQPTAPVPPNAHNTFLSQGIDFRRPAGFAAPPHRHAHIHRDLFFPHGPNDHHRPQGNVSRISHSIQRAVMAAMPVPHGLLGLLARDVHVPAELNIAMDYGALPFDHVQPAEPRKTPHVPPKPARPGYTRTPATLEEDQILICPACEEELVQHPNEKPPPTTNSKGKALTDKERAEHPFWVVRKCGHVFCNKCYQDRKNKTNDSKFYAPNRPKSEKSLVCPVEECSSAVGKPTDWIGIFL